VLINQPWADPSGKNKNKRTAGIDRYDVQLLPLSFLIVWFWLSKWICAGCQGLFEKKLLDIFSGAI
jgi:hypothetical protein